MFGPLHDPFHVQGAAVFVGFSHAPRLIKFVDLSYVTTEARVNLNRMPSNQWFCVKYNILRVNKVPALPKLAVNGNENCKVVRKPKRKI
jgi:hypothetical protein